MPKLLRQAISADGTEPALPRNRPEWQKALLGVAIAPLFIIGYGLFIYASEGSKGEPGDRQFACMVSLDGSMSDLVYEVKRGLRDTGSFEHIRSSATPVDADGLQRVRMNFRARNGFGGMNVETVEGVVSNSDCKLLSWMYRP